MTDCNCETCKDVEMLSIIIDKLRDIHRPVLFKGHFETYICYSCHSTYPCREAKILDGDFS